MKLRCVRADRGISRTGPGFLSGLGLLFGPSDLRYATGSEEKYLRTNVVAKMLTNAGGCHGAAWQAWEFHAVRSIDSATAPFTNRIRFLSVFTHPLHGDCVLLEANA
jgi:hypothetical protein